MRDIYTGEMDVTEETSFIETFHSEFKNCLIVNRLGGGEWRRQRGGGGGTRFVAAGTRGKVGENFC